MKERWTAIERAMFSIFCCAVGLAVPLSGFAAGRNYALVAGVNECRDFVVDGTRPRPLEGAENDAESFRDLLRDQYGFENVEFLKGEDAKKDRIQQKFYEIAKKLGRDDQFVFYFAGHG